MSKQFLAVLAIIILGLFGIFTLTKEKTDTPGSNGNTNVTAKGSNNVFGDNKKKVVLLEFGDFQCPACKSYAPLLKEVKAKYKADITFQFKHFPLQQIHPNARAASRAAQAAANQNKFWEMHDLLYEQQDIWGPSTAINPLLEGFANQIGLNVAKYKTDFASTAVNDIINADFAEGTKKGVDSTPTFFLQGKKLSKPPQDIAGFNKIIDEAIKAANKTK